MISMIFDVFSMNFVDISTRTYAETHIYSHVCHIFTFLGCVPNHIYVTFWSVSMFSYIRVDVTTHTGKPCSGKNQDVGTWPRGNNLILMGLWQRWICGKVTIQVICERTKFDFTIGIRSKRELQAQFWCCWWIIASRCTSWQCKTKCKTIGSF